MSYDSDKFIGVSTLGNTLGNTGLVSGRLVLQGTDNITLSQATAAGGLATIIISGPTPGGGGAGFSAGISTLGNTSGDTGTVASRLVLAGGNNITLSGSTAGSSATVTISGASQSAESQSIGMSNVGNTSGTTGVASGAQVRFVLAGGNNVTLSQSLDGASGTLTISAFTQTVQTQNMVAVTLSGNTSGALALVSSGTLTLAGGNNITLSQAGNAVTISAGAGGGGFTRSKFNPYMAVMPIAGQQGNGTLHLSPIPDVEAFQFDRVLFDVHGTQGTATNSSGSFTVSMNVGLYTRNVSTLSLLVSSSSSHGITVSGTVRSASNNGPRLLSVGWTTTIAQNDLWIGIMSRTSSSSANLFTLSQYLGSDIATNFSGMLGVATNATIQNILGLGIYSASTSAIPGSIAFNQITGSASLPLRVPIYYFLSQTA